MADIPIDTNVIIRYLVEDPATIPPKFRGVYSFFEKVEIGRLVPEGASKGLIPGASWIDRRFGASGPCLAKTRGYASTGGPCGRLVRQRRRPGGSRGAGGTSQAGDRRAWPRLKPHPRRVGARP